MLEGTSKLVKLEDVDPEIFEQLHYWLYYQRLPFPPEELVDGGNDLGLLSKIWNLADRFRIIELMNAAIADLYDILIDPEFNNEHDLIEFIHHA